MNTAGIFKSLLLDETGVSTTEYSLIASMIALAAGSTIYDAGNQHAYNMDRAAVAMIGSPQLNEIASWIPRDVRYGSNLDILARSIGVTFKDHTGTRLTSAEASVVKDIDLNPVPYMKIDAKYKDQVPTQTFSGTGGLKLTGPHRQLFALKNTNTGDTQIESGHVYTLGQGTLGGNVSITGGSDLHLGTLAGPSVSGDSVSIGDLTPNQPQGNLLMTSLDNQFDSNTSVEMYSGDNSGASVFMVSGTTQSIKNLSSTQQGNAGDVVIENRSFGSGSLTVNSDRDTVFGTRLGSGNSNMSIIDGGGGGRLSITKNGTGNLQLGSYLPMSASGKNTVAYSGSTVINSGKLSIVGAHFDNSAVSVNSGTELVLDPGNTLTSNGRVNTLDGSDSTQSVDSCISGAGTVRKIGAGTTELGCNNTNFTGNFAIDEGSITAASGSTNPFGTGNLQLASGVDFDVKDATSIGGTITGAGSLQKSVAGTTYLSGTNTYTGGTTITDGTLALNGSDNSLGTGSVSVSSPGALDLGQVTTSIANTMTGDGTIKKTGDTTTTLTGNNNGFSGSYDLTEGTVRISSQSNLGSGDVNLGASATLDIGSIASVSNEFSGNGTLLKSGAGTLNISQASNSFSGLVDVNSGSVDLNNADGVGSGRIDLASGTTMNVANTVTDMPYFSGNGTVNTTDSTTISDSNTIFTGQYNVTNGTLTIGNNSSLGTGTANLASGTSMTVASNVSNMTSSIAGSGSVAISNNLTLSKSSTSYSGTVNVNGGTLTVNHTNALGTGTANLASGTNMAIASSVSSLSNSITGSGSIAVSNNLTLSKSNTGYSGTVNVNGGTLSVTNANALGTGTANLATGASMTVASSVSSLNNAIAGSGSIAVSNNLTLSKSSTSYAGTVNVNGGTLSVTNANALGTGTANLASGTSMNIASSVSSLSNSIAGSGSVAVSNNLTLSKSSTGYSGTINVSNGTLNVTNANAVGSGTIVLAAGSTLNLNGLSIPPSQIINNGGTIIP